MGDLKKKKPKDDIKTDHMVNADEEVIEKLRDYIRQFYEMQVEKMEKADKTK